MASRVAARLYYGEAAEERTGKEDRGVPADPLQFRATVTDIRLVSRAKPDAPAMPDAQAPLPVPHAGAQLWQVALDQTAFYPEGGGQPWDTGVLIATARSGVVLEVVVERVEEDATGEVWHYVSKPLLEGTTVLGRVDSERRMDHVQQHSGQHLLSAIFLRELGARTVSFHLSSHAGSSPGNESVTIDLAGVDTLSGDDLRRVEAAVNRVVYQDRALGSRWVSRSEAEAMLQRGDLRKLPEFEDYRAGGPVRVVEIEGVEYNACGGTHVRSTGAIGAVLIRRVERVKQGWRVEFCCGLRAVRVAGRDFAQLSQAAAKLSTGLTEVPERLAGLLEEAKTAAKERKALLEDLARSEAALLVSGVEVGGVVTAIFPGKDLEFIKRVAAKIAELGRAAVVGTTGTSSLPGTEKHGEGALAIARWAGSTIHCGNRLRETLSAAGGRGGGAAEMAQGICPGDQLQSVMTQLAEELSR